MDPFIGWVLIGMPIWGITCLVDKKMSSSDFFADSKSIYLHMFGILTWPMWLLFLSMFLVVVIATSIGMRRYIPRGYEINVSSKGVLTKVNWKETGF